MGNLADDRGTLSKSDERDRRADAVDAAAARADMGANLRDWLHDRDKTGAAQDQRRAAARDRDTARAARRSDAAERSARSAPRVDGDDVR